jgi:hypothetical protein
MQKIFEIRCGRTISSEEILQHRLLAAADGGLIDTQRVGYFGF